MHNDILNLSINNNCNNNCKYCFQDKYNNINPSYRSIEEIQYLINRLCLDPNDTHINLLGGEPILHPDIIKLLKLLLSNNFSVTLITNLLQANNKIIKGIIDLIKLYPNSLSFLINCNHSKKYNELFEKNLEQLFNNTKNITLSFTFFDLGENDNLSIEYLEFLNKKFNKYNLTFRISSASPNLQYFELKDFTDIYTRCIKIIKKYKSRMVFDCSLNFCEITTNFFEKEDNENLNLINKTKNQCFGAYDLLLDNRLYFCNSCPQEISVYILDYDSLEEAKLALQFLLLEYLKDIPDYQCLHCDNFGNICLGLCPAKILKLEGQRKQSD